MTVLLSTYPDRPTLATPAKGYTLDPLIRLDPRAGQAHGFPVFRHFNFHFRTIFKFSMVSSIRFIQFLR
jgi:hypothetical protein